MKTITMRFIAPLALMIALLAPSWAGAVNVGYYEMCNGEGATYQVGPITAAGHTPVKITTPDATQLSNVDVLFVTNCDNGGFNSEYVANLPAIAAAVSSGGLALIIHDRFVASAGAILPGGAGISIFRDFTDPTNVEIRSNTLVTSGAAGTLDNTSLDNGNFSTHGYALANTLPAGAVNILSTGTPDHSVLFSYEHGTGSVIYSTIPLDCYIGPFCGGPLSVTLTNIYTPNVIEYAASLLGGSPPVLAGLVDITAEGSSPAGAVVAFNITANDPEDGAVEVSCTPASGSLFALGGTLVSCNASDSDGNMVSGNFTVNVVDTTPPTVDAPANITHEASNASGATVTFTATASDAVSPGVVAVCTPPSGSTFALGTTPVNCVATDAAGNTGADTFTVTIQDTTAPTLTCPAAVSGAPGLTVNLGTPTVSDAVDATVALTNNAPATFLPGVTTVRWTATDDAGNASTCDQTVTLRYTFHGFFQPVDNFPTVNTVKGGSTVPVKWRLVDANGANVTDPSVVTGTTYTPMVCGGAEDAIEQTVASGGTSLRWDGTQFVYNWKTPATPGKCVRLTVNFSDGTGQSANFKLK